MREEVAFQSSGLRVRFWAMWTSIRLRVGMGELVGLEMSNSSEGSLTSRMRAANKFYFRWLLFLFLLKSIIARLMHTSGGRTLVACWSESSSLFLAPEVWAWLLSLPRAFHRLITLKPYQVRSLFCFLKYPLLLNALKIYLIHWSYGNLKEYCRSSY